MSHALFLSIFIVIMLCLFIYKYVFTISSQGNQDEEIADTIEYESPLSEDEIQEMYKGVQGDLTLEEVDSILRSK